MEGVRPIDGRVIKDTRAVLISSPKGVSINRFPIDYRKLVGRPFPYRDHGYQTSLAMLRAMERNGIIRFTKTGDDKDGGWILFGVPDDNHFTPSWVKKINDEKPSLPLDHNGEILLFVRWEYRHRKKPFNHLTVKQRKEKLSQLMSRAGNPLEITIAGPQYSFVRFGSHEEARKAIDMLNKYQSGDIVYYIQPAKRTKHNRTSKHSLVGDICIEDISPPWKKIACDTITPSYDLTVPSCDNHYDYCDSESDDDVTWDETLLYNQTSHASLNGIRENRYDHIWSSDVLTKCNGGISWSERISVMCGLVTVRITSVTPSLCIWVQVLNTPEMECFLALEKYIKTYHLHPLDQTPNVGGIYVTNSGNTPYQRCYILEYDPHDGHPLVFYLDTGEVRVILSSSLFSIPKCYAEFPMMAIPCQSQDISTLSLNESIIDILLKEELAVELKPPECLLSLPLNIQFDDKVLSKISDITASSIHTTSVPITSSHSLFGNGTVSPNSIYGSNVESQNTDIPSQWLLNTVNCNGLFPVHVSEVVSPGLFWIQLTQDPARDIQWISKIISSDNTPPILQVNREEIYAYKHETMNYRVKIQTISEKGEQASVLCVDTGILLQVSICHLHTLLPSLSLDNLPALALPSSIHGMIPTREDKKWWTLDSQLLWKLIKNKNVFVKFKDKGTSNPLLNHTKFNLDPISLSVYLDSEGWDSVTDLLIQDGHYVDLDPAIKGLNELKIY